VSRLKLALDTMVTTSRNKRELANTGISYIGCNVWMPTQPISTTIVVCYCH